MKELNVAELSIVTASASVDRICYLLSPFYGIEDWAEETAHRLGVSIAVITGMDWDDDLTPWPAKGEPPGCPDFKGNASKFLSVLTAEVIPAVERQLGISRNVERTLAGVSLSGLFTLWQWLVDDTFKNIISLSGSFWYDGFLEWVKSRPVPKKTGKACFLLGRQEAKASVKAFQSVQADTTEIVRYLHESGVDVEFELVPGNHYQYAEERLDRSFTWMFGQRRD